MRPLIDTFIQVANKNPQQIAIKDHIREIDYHDLLSAIEITASWFGLNGFQKGDRVGLHLKNSFEYVIVYYACWHRGMVPVALNTNASQVEIDFWLSDSGCKIFFSNTINPGDPSIEVANLLWSDGQVIINHECLPSKIEECLVQVDLNDVATIIYTSGTTGNPKGITLLHVNLATNIYAVANSLVITEKDRFLCVLPFYYSFGNSVLHSHLVTGSSLVLHNQVLYPATILQAIEKNKCHGFAGVPSLYISLLKKTDISKYDLSSLRYMTQAGGPLSREFISQIKVLLPSINFVVMYGQTEASARISYLPPERLEEKIGSVGIAVKGVTISILDEHGNKCVPGKTGEICISGKSVMDRYWNNPDATQKVLKNGLLHTGDMGYKDNDGFLYIVGRQTEILKISEHRVSPYEIEEVILQMPAIDECAVIGCDHEQMGQYAKAVVVINSEVSIKDIKKHCKQMLANYKIPKDIEVVSQLPKTSSGKIKRKQLTC